MAKFIVDEEVAMATIEKWGSGELTKALFRDVFSKSKEVECCDTCGDGCGPFTTRGIEGKCWCKRSRKYEQPTHYCAAWRKKNAHQ